MLKLFKLMGNLLDMLLANLSRRRDGVYFEAYDKQKYEPLCAEIATSRKLIIGYRNKIYRFHMLGKVFIILL